MNSRKRGGEQLLKLSTSLEKRNARLLSGLFRGNRDITSFSTPISDMSSSQLRVVVGALLRARRIWMPSDAEQIVSKAADSRHLAINGEPSLAKQEMASALRSAIATENFEAGLAILGDRMSKDHASTYNLLRGKLQQVHQLHDIWHQLRDVPRLSRSTSLPELLEVAALTSPAQSKRASFLIASIQLRLHFLLGNYEKAMPFAQYLRQHRAEPESTDSLLVYFQATTLSIILGDLPGAKADLAWIMTIDSVGHDFDRFKLCEQIIASLIIALTFNRERDLGLQAIALLLNTWKPNTDHEAVEQSRYAIMVTFALQFTVLERLPSHTELILTEMLPKVNKSSISHSWGCILEVSHYLIQYDPDELRHAIRRLRGAMPTDTGHMLLRFLNEYLEVAQSSFARDAILARYEGLASTLPSHERERLDLGVIFALKLGVPWSPGKSKSDLSVASC